MTATIEFKGLTKRYGAKPAVADFTASIAKGRITGFLGPNGAGKSTALRCLLGLANPTAGEALIHGVPYKGIENSIRQVGAVLDSRGFYKALTGRRNLEIYAAAAGVKKARVAEVLELVELTAAADQKFKGYSLGMKQRLALAAALLGDPEVLILDEPANGLDPLGIAWLRNFLRRAADQGKTVLVSSHQLAEMEHTVDDVIIINQGRLVTAGPKDQVCQGRSLEERFIELTAKEGLQ